MNMPTSGAPTARNRGSKSCRVLLWPGRFRSDYLNPISLILFFRVPQIHKEFRCGRTVPCVVIVAESEDFQDCSFDHFSRRIEVNTYPESGVLPLDDLPPVASKKKTNRSVFPVIGTPTILSTNLIEFCAVVNRASRGSHLQIYNRWAFSADFVSALPP